ncbi:MAG: formimidoylglutamase [Croceitalea sp.]|nr:formimidoylglutamase [Croceitalea sp.]
METYQKPQKHIWTGRDSGRKLYVHEKVSCVPVSSIEMETEKQFVLLGYACDEGVKRNHGRVGAEVGPLEIRKQLGKMPNHLNEDKLLIDAGDLFCPYGNMEETQKELSTKVYEILKKNALPIVIGGGHDVAYGHFNGIKQYLHEQANKPTIGIINFDAHFDLRNNDQGNNSGTPFYQIAQENESFHYLCLGVRKDANDAELFATADKLEVTYLMKDTFRIQFVEEINKWIRAFLKKVDVVYVTIDLDGFSSAYAPGVSAPSPMGFSPDIVTESLETIISSGKLISFDIAEMNPDYDSDHLTAKLAASLIHKVIHAEYA